MLLYNTTYHVEPDQTDVFLIWLREKYIPEVIENGLLAAPRLYKILSQAEEEGERFCLQWDVENSTLLHRWYFTQGAKLNEELEKIFQQKVLGIPTLMEVLK